MANPNQLPKPQTPAPSPDRTLPAETWWERKIRSHPLFARRASLPRVQENPTLMTPRRSPFALTSGWLVATMLVYLIGTAIVVWVAFRQ